MVKFPVPNLPADAAANLGWLLLNNQVSDEMLCAILLAGFRAELERLAAALSASPAVDSGVVEQALIQAILNRRGYTGEGSGKAWLFALLVRECAAPLPGAPRQEHAPVEIESFDPRPYADPHFKPLLKSLNKTQALLLVLHYAHGFTLEEIAFLLRQPLEQIQVMFAQIHERLDEHRQSCVLCASPDGSLSALEHLLRRAIRPGSALVDLDERHMNGWQSAVLAGVSRERGIRRAHLQKKRAIQASLAAAFLLAVGWLSLLAGPALPPAAAGPAASATPALAQSIALPSPTAPPARPTPRPSVEPTVASAPATSVDSILRLSAASRSAWKTLWADVQITRYWPDSSGSVPFSFIRKQIWASQPASARVISGSQPGPPSGTYALFNGRFFKQNFQTGQTDSGSTSRLITDDDLRLLYIPEDMFPHGGTLTMTGSQPVASRPAWILQWNIPGGPMYRFWVDQQNGVILQRQDYSGQGGNVLLSEITTRAITFDAPIPLSVFQPSQYRGSQYATAFSGTPDTAGLTTLLSAPQLSAPVSLPQVSPGSLLSCASAPDGSQVAFTTAHRENTIDTALSFAGPTTGQSARRALPGGITSGDYAFAPDSDRLAFFGCEQTAAECAVYILNTRTGQRARLIQVEYADYIFWKPDGRYVALVGMHDSSAILAAKANTNLLMNELMALSQRWHFYVIEVDTGKIIFKRPYEWALPGAPAGSPTFTWGETFKALLPGAEGCFNSPVGRLGSLRSPG